MSGKDGKKETKTDYVQNYKEREDFIQRNGRGDRKKGEQAFLRMCEKDEHWKKLQDIPVPSRFSWIWLKFLEIWRGCERDMSGNAVFTFQTINEYEKCMNVPLTVTDKQELFKIKTWAMNAIFELSEKE